MITESGGPVLMTYSWTLLAPRGHWEYTKQMQTGKREGSGGRWGRSEGGIGRTMVEHRWKEKNILNRTNDEDERVNDSVLIILTTFPHICVSLRKENLSVGFKGH